MKPLRLTLEGLQSYREEQTIDFSLFNGCGLFGIFGPTGSGKSTILDAMTLALYGRVTRANFKTQGIINSSCDKAAVSLSFALSLDGERRAYRVERVYRRKKLAPDSCEARVTRLVLCAQADGEGPGQVLADKAGEVDEAVEKLLGLGFDDFTRAVVLPQNQFHEFLLLGKKDKSDMLERLFGLEIYGRELSRKIAAGRRLADEEIAGANGALNVLEDSSDAAVNELKAAVGAAGEALRAAVVQDAAVKAQLEAGRVIYQLAQEKSRLLERQASLISRSQIMAAAGEKLARARAAEPIWPLWADFDRTKKEITETQSSLSALTVKLSQLDEQLDVSRSLAVQDQAEAGPRRESLARQTRQLELACSLAEQLESLEQRLMVFQNEQNRLNSEFSETKTAAEKLAGQLEALDASLNKKRDRRQALAVDPAWRRSLERLQSLYSQTAERRGELSLAEIARQELAERLEGLREAERLQSQDLTAEQSAALLAAAAHLVDGEPCPVCGSTHHPAPAQPDSQPGHLLTAAQTAAARRELAQTEERLKASMQTCSALQMKIDRLDQELNDLITGQPSLADVLDPSAQLALIHQYEVELAELDRQLPALENAAAEARRMAQTESARREQLAGQLAGGASLAAELAGQRDNLLASLSAEMPQTRPGSLKSAEIKLLLNEMLEQDARDEARSRQLQADLTALEQQQQPLVHEQISLKTRLSVSSARFDEISAALTAALTAAGFTDTGDLASSRMDPAAAAALEQDLKTFESDTRDVQLQLQVCNGKLQGGWLDEPDWNRLNAQAVEAGDTLGQARRQEDRVRQRLDDLMKTREIRRQQELVLAAATARRARIGQIDALVRGNAFVEYVAEEKLRGIVAEATEYLQAMTRFRYALELDSERSFIVRDQMNGGEVRMAGSLSGGETFMASLALALALSSQIQIRGQSRLEFFFLDEGFGSLDTDLLDIVMDSLERISSPQRLIGLISHVPELRHRIGTRLVIEPAGSRGGSRIMLEHG